MMLNTQTPFDSLWNYQDPGATETLFRNMLQNEDIQSNVDLRGQLQTQIVRTLSLQAKFEEALQLLEFMEHQYDFSEYPLIGIRFYLEKGRTLNSSSIRRQAFKCFEQAYQLAITHQTSFYVVDALHMMAIAADGPDALKWNELAMQKAEASKDPRTKKWLGALYNNIGWYYFDDKQFETAWSLFKKALDWRLEKGDAAGIRVAHWCVARTNRALGHIEDALYIQEKLYQEIIQEGIEDGFIDEELGELYLLKGLKDSSTFHFKRAYNALSKDIWLQRNDAERLNRMQKLSN